MFELIWILIFLSIGISIVKGISEWSRNKNSPVSTEKAVVVKKRKKTYTYNNGYYKKYFTTFQLVSGEQLKLKVSQKTYKELEEGMEGSLTYQGTRYHSFEVKN